MGRAMFILAALMMAVAAAEEIVTECDFFKPQEGRQIYLIDTINEMRDDNSDNPLYCKCANDGTDYRVECIGVDTDWKWMGVTGGVIGNKIDPMISYRLVKDTGVEEVYFQCENSIDKVESQCKKILGENEAACSQEKLNEKCP